MLHGRSPAGCSPAGIQPDQALMTNLTNLPISLPLRVLRVSVTAAAITAGTAAAFGQDAADGSPGFLDGLFGRGEQAAPPARPDRLAQSSANDLSVRIDRLEAQIRQMTGVIEELQFHNQQMADQLRRMQDDGQSSAAQPPRPGGAPSGAPAMARPPGTGGAAAGQRPPRRRVRSHAKPHRPRRAPDARRAPGRRRHDGAESGRPTPASRRRLRSALPAAGPPANRSICPP